MKLYHIIRPVITLAFKTYFKKVHYTGTEHIPHGKPMIFSCNHPTGFFEPCLLACLTWDVEYNFITRGDFFKKPFYRRILESLFMIPIFRFKDGFSNLKNNAQSMEFIYKALADKKSILIFGEGGTETGKRLRPIQKGLARMAFGNYDVYGDLDLHIVPVCVTYTDAHTFRSEVMVQFGEAIPLSKYYTIYAENNNKAVNHLTADVQSIMRPLLVEIEKPENEEVTEQLFTLYRNTYPEALFPIFKKSKRRLLAHQEIAKNINQLSDSQLVAVKNNLDNYFKKLQSKSLDDIAIAQPWHSNSKNLMALIIGFIPYIIGYLGHLLPSWYAFKVRKEKVKYVEFEGPVMAAVAIAVILIQYIILFITAFIVNHWAFCALVLLLPFLGFYSIYYKELRDKYRLCSRLKTISTEGVDELITERESILKMVR
jgi:glycerol-3-phosphate O-acyltransferase / dihydroxyacetone phosphate acyltransferase